MQTFLPYADFHRCAAVLDPQRLGKQRVEVLQILRALHFDGYGWARHPAVLMWRGWTPALVAYGLAMTERWTAAGRPDSTAVQIAEFAPDPSADQRALRERGMLPSWLGSRTLHDSHRSALLRKDPGHYRRWFPRVAPDLPYVWPEPGPPAALPPVSAWLVRGARRRGDVVLPDAGLGGPRRAALALERFQHGLDDVTVVVLADGDRLTVGEVTGAARRRRDAWSRPVIWFRDVDRTALRFPAALQNPQPVSPLHGEDRLRS